jgi:two-component system, sensor histidine kinase and response regulator
MTQALASGDMSPLLHTAHALKGTLGLFGAAPAVALAAALEKLAATGQTPATASSVAGNATIAAQLAELLTQVGYLLAALNSRSAR